MTRVLTIMLLLVCSVCSADVKVIYRVRGPFRTCFGEPDDGSRRITFIEAEIEVPRGASIMGWGVTRDVARRNVIDAWYRRQVDLLLSRDASVAPTFVE